LLASLDTPAAQAELRRQAAALASATVADEQVSGRGGGGGGVRRDGFCPALATRTPLLSLPASCNLLSPTWRRRCALIAHVFGFILFLTTRVPLWHPLERGRAVMRVHELLLWHLCVYVATGSARHGQFRERCLKTRSHLRPPSKPLAPQQQQHGPYSAGRFRRASALARHRVGPRGSERACSRCGCGDSHRPRRCPCRCFCRCGGGRGASGRGRRCVHRDLLSALARGISQQQQHQQQQQQQQQQRH
jgi:hypothetical protein